MTKRKNKQFMNEKMQENMKKRAKYVSKKQKEQRTKPVERHINFDTKKRQLPVDEKKLEKLQSKMQVLQKQEQNSTNERRKIAHAMKSRLNKKMKILQVLKLKQEGKFVPQEFMTIEKMRLPDLSAEAHKNKSAEEELVHAETNDEMQQYFTLGRDPKVAITTTSYEHELCVELAKDLEAIFGQTITYVRRPSTQPDIREMCVDMIEQGFTSLIVVHADSQGQPSHLMVIALPLGPTAYFRLTSLYLRRQLKDCVEPLKLNPEVVLTNFTTRLGRRVARVLQQTLSQAEVLKGRQVVTFHNQRDFIFFRAYRYQFKESKKVANEDEKMQLSDKVNVGMDEIGPEFTLRLRWLQEGIYNPQYEEFEFVQPAHEESINKRLMFL